MMARLEMVEVLLTARMGDVFHRFGHPILAGDAPFAELHPKSVMVQARHPRRLCKRQPTSCVKAAGQLGLPAPVRPDQVAGS